MKINTDPIFSYTPIPKEVKEKMLGLSMPENIPISFDELSYLNLSYYYYIISLYKVNKIKYTSIKKE